MIENLYILGAGASVDAGVPIMSNFLDVAEDLIVAKKYRDSSEIEELFKTIKSLNSLHAKSNINLDNIESVLGLLEMSELLRYSSNVVNLNFKSLKSSYIRMITETIEQSMKFKIEDARRITPTGSYQRFSQILKEDKKHQTSAIITFNYDLGIDVALNNVGIKYSYNLTETPETFPLLKLHGSLNWFEDLAGEIKSYYLTDFFRKRQYNFIDASEGRDGILSFTDFINEDHRNKHQNNPTPFIIPPTWNKTMYHEKISNVWRKASECLAEAKNIYIIGYSLPEADAFFRFLFSLGTNSQTRIRKFWVINPDSNGTEKRYKDLLGRQIQERFRYFNMPFSMALTSLDWQ